uniref:Uncharacterized protein n=1 Tax=Equus caballus TaxID=9796 RepID=A0A3Q2I0R5_HORSE
KLCSGCMLRLFAFPWIIHSRLPTFHPLPNGEAGPVLLRLAIKLLLQDRGGEKNENSAQRAAEGKWGSFRAGPTDRSGQGEVASSSEKWRAPQEAGPSRQTSLLGCSWEEVRLGVGWGGAVSAEDWAALEPGKGY